MLFSEILDSVALRSGACTVAVSPDWAQGRSVFGGMQSALALRAMRSLVPSDIPLRVLQTTFVAPVTGTVTLEARVLRAGRSAIHAEARLIDGNETCAIVVGVFGRARPSEAQLTAQVPAIPLRGEAFDFEYRPGVSPSFGQHFTMRWVTGAPPFSGSREAPRAIMDIGIKDRAPATEAHVVAIADAPPPLASTMLTARAFGSSATWTLEMLVDSFDAFPLSGWRLYAELRSAREGYTSQVVTVCSPDGKPAALSQQSMLIFG